MIITVTVHPKAKKPKIEKDLFGQLHVYVSQLPLEGRANKAVTEALAKHFKVKRYQIRLIRGERSKVKVFEIG